MSKPAWKHEDRPELGLLNSVSAAIERFESRSPGVLKTTSKGRNLLIASDYGGEHKGAIARTYAFLLIDLDYTWLFFKECERVRREILGHDRRMAYKSLNDAVRQRTLVPFLRAANTLVGTLCIFCVDNSLDLWSGFPIQEGTLLPEFSSISGWNRKSALKLVQVAHFGGLLCGGFAGKSQNIIWISDDDEFTTDAVRVTTSTRLLAHVCGHFLYNPPGHFRFGSSGMTDHERQSEDLAAIPDLAAGALSDAFDKFEVWEGDAWANKEPIRPGDIKAKAHVVVGWLADASPTSLGRLIVRLLPGQAGKVNIQVSEAHADGAVSQFNIAPVVAHHFRLGQVFDEPHR